MWRNTQHFMSLWRTLKPVICKVQRFDVADNPQATVDWLVHGLSYEDDALQRSDEAVRFTHVDFAACDPRYARYCEPTPRDNWRDDMTTVGDYLALGPEQRAGRRPYVVTVDAGNALYRTVVDEKLIDAARHCADSWQRLQELGGVNNSHANRLLARERAAWEEQNGQHLGELQTVAPPEPALPAEAASQPPPAQRTPTAAEPADAEDPPAVDPDEAWIETARCTTCNECTQINNRMFVYNENMQAYIADPDAGTYRQMVEAAESCQVSIIHPGKPRDPTEPNLEELIAQAEPFL